VGLAEGGLGLLARQALGAQVDQHDMALGAAADDAQAALGQRLRQHAGVGHHLHLVGLELGRQRLLEGHRLGRDHVHQRPALDAGEDGAVDLLGDGLVVGQHDAAARATQALVGGARHHVGVGHRVGIDAGGDEAGVMRDVDHEDGAHGLGHAGEAFEVDAQAVGAGAGDDELGPVLVGQALHGVVVDDFLRVQAVAHDLEPLAAHVQRHAVGEMAALGQAHAHDGVAGLQQAEEDGLVGLAAAVGLHVGVLRAKELLAALDGQCLGHVDELAAAVVALARVALGVFVGELRTLRFHHRRRGVVLARDELDVIFLAPVLGLHGGPDLGVDAGDGGQGTVEHAGSPLRVEVPSTGRRAPCWRFAVEGCPGARLKRRLQRRAVCASRWFSTSGSGV